MRIDFNHNYALCFKRTWDGVLVENGKYGPNREYLSTKYTNEVRLCIGVAMVELPDGLKECRRDNTFDYSCKVII